MRSSSLKMCVAIVNDCFCSWCCLLWWVVVVVVWVSLLSSSHFGFIDREHIVRFSFFPCRLSFLTTLMLGIPTDVAVDPTKSMRIFYSHHHRWWIFTCIWCNDTPSHIYQSIELFHRHGCYFGGSFLQFSMCVCVRSKAACVSIPFLVATGAFFCSFLHNACVPNISVCIIHAMNIFLPKSSVGFRFYFFYLHSVECRYTFPSSVS